MSDATERLRDLRKTLEQAEKAQPTFRWENFLVGVLVGWFALTLLEAWGRSQQKHDTLKGKTLKGPVLLRPEDQQFIDEQVEKL